MKKLLKLVSIMLIMAMILPMTPIEIFAAETSTEQTQTTPTVNADGSKVYTVNGYSAASVDGVVGADEYTTTANLSIAGYSGNLSFTQKRDSALSSDEQTKVSESISMSFSHDEEKIYVGILDKSGTATVRNGYAIRLGFDPEHPENYVGLWLQCANVTGDGTSPSTSVTNCLLTTADGYAYPQAGYRGIVASNGSFSWGPSAHSGDAVTRLKYSADNASYFPMTAAKLSKVAVSGNITTSDENGRVSSGQHYTHYELEFDKDLLLAFFNDMTFNSGAAVENLDTMLFSIQQTETASGEHVNALWGGSFDEGTTSATSNPLASYNFDRVVFSNEVDDDFGNDNDTDYPEGWNPNESVFGEFATSTHDTSLTQLGQDIYSTGSNNYKVADSDIDATDGVIDSAYVKVTPNPVDHGPSHTYIQYTSNKGWNGQSPLEIRTDWDAYAALLPDVNYYVAQSNDYIYLVVEEDVPYITEGVTVSGTESKLYSMNSWGYYFLRLGFNPNDYSQQICIDNNTKEWFTCSWLADNTTKYDISESGVMASWARSTPNYEEPRTQSWKRISEVKLSKAALKTVYANNFGVTLTDSDLNAMFIGLSVQNYARRDNDYSATSTKTNDRIGNPIYGSFSAETIASSENNWIPDVIVFGEEKSGTAFASCSFTGHSLEDRYLVEGTTDTYYHVCTHCGMAGASTFKVANDALVFDKEVVSEDTEITAGNCSTMGTYYKSCSCGLVSENPADTFEFGGDHDFTAKVVADQYLVKAATCIAGGIYYVSCKYCGESSEDTTAEDTFTTAPTLWPAGAVKPVYHGQRTFYTGDNYTVKDSDITTTAWAPIDSDLVLVTPNALTGTPVNNKNPNGGSVVTGATIYDSSDYSPLFTPFKYYAAKSDTTMYLSFEQYYNYYEAGVNGDTSVKTWGDQIYRIGFNKNDYTQQLVLNVPGHGVGGNSITIGYSTANSYTQLYSGKISGMAEGLNTALADKLDGTLDLFTILVGGNLDNVTTQSSIRIHNFKFKLQGIKDLWKACFGVELKDSDLDAVYTSIVHQTYGNPSGSQRALVYHGTTLTSSEATAAGLSQYLPDLIVFGSEKTLCDYTAHVADDIYLVAGTTDTYYHSCPDCGDIGTKTFKYVDGAVVYDVENKDAEGAAVIAATCESAGTYYKSCACGVLGTDTFTVDALGHTGATTFESDAEGHWTVCSVCDTEGTALPTGGIKVTHAYTIAEGENVFEAGNCTTAPKFYKLCECGKVATEAGEGNANIFEGSVPGHTGANERVLNDAEGHWTVCDACYEGDAVVPEGNSKTAHTYTVENTEIAGAEISAPDCDDNGVYRLSCTCGYIDTTNNTNTFEVDPLGHNFNDNTTKTFKATDATCTAEATYFVECSVCHVTSEGTDEEATYAAEGTKDAHIADAIANGDRVTVAAKAPSCAAFGWNEYVECECGYSTLEANKIPSLHTTAGTPTIAEYLKKNVPVHVTGANVAVAPNAADAKVTDGEYSVSYVIDAPVALTNQYMYDSYKNWTEVSKSGLSADVQKVIDTEKVRYSFAQDDDHFYVAIEHISGVGDTYNNQRTRYEYAFVLNPGLENEKTIAFVSQYQFSTTKWSTSSFKVMNPMNNVDYSMTSGWLGTGDRANWSAYVRRDGTTGKYMNVFDATYVAKRFQSEDGVYEFDNYTVEKGVDAANGWTKNSCATTIELVLDKAELAKLLGANATVNDLSDVLGFTLMTTAGVYEKATVATTAPADGATHHLLWNGTPIFGSNNLGFANDVRVNPDLVIFGQDDAIGCNFTHIIDDKYKIATDANGVTSYYHACDGRDCGLISSTVYYVDAEGNIIYDVETSVAKTAVTCETDGEYYYGCTCGVVDPNGATYTVKALGHEADTSLEFNADGHWTVCDRCDTEGVALPTGGIMVDHVFDQTDILDGNMAVLGDCDTKTTYYKNCECGHFLDTNDTFEGDFVHYLVDVVDEKYLLLRRRKKRRIGPPERWFPSH